MSRHPIWFVGNAHIDPVWLWNWQEGFSEIKATFQSALDRMDESDDFVFTCAGASYYKWVEENEPEMMEKIKARVAEGRWVIAGGWWVQPDCNMPCGESFARHSLYSQALYRRLFGRQAEFGYNVDSFGHNGNLPQIYALSEMPCYVMMRPMEHEKAIGADAFYWRGVDGTEIPTYRIPFGYGTGWEADLTDDLRALQARSERDDEAKMLFYGVGNHGGGPTVRQIRQIEGFEKEDPSQRFGSPRDFFAYIGDGHPLHRTVEGDLQHHAIGCYSSRSDIKRNNRKAENRLLAAEKLANAARAVIGMKDVRPMMQKAWEDVMFNQFHDVMCGCSIRSAYDDARDMHGEALRLSGEALNFAAQRISWHIDTRRGRDLSATNISGWAAWERKVGGFPVVVFNTNAYPVNACVKLSRPIKGVLDEEGKALPVQNVRSEKTVSEVQRDVEAVLRLDVPAMGYRTVYIRREAEPDAPAELSGRKLRWGSAWLENDWWRIEFDRASGCVSRLYDKTRKAEVFSGLAARGEVIEDFQNDTWAHGRNSLKGTVGFFDHGRLTLREHGDVCAVLRAESRFESSTLIQDFTIYRDSPDIDVHLTVNWQEPFRILKMVFPLNGDETKAVYQIPYGVIEKPANGEEEAAQAWAAVTGRCDGQPASVAVINDSVYSYSVEDNVLRFIAVRSSGAADHYGIKDEYTLVNDIGVREMNYRIVPMGETDTAALTRADGAMNQPPFPAYETFHGGELPESASYAWCDGALLNVIKAAEDGDGLIVRLNETSGVDSHAAVELGFIGRRFETDLRPYQIRSFRVTDAGVSEVDLLEK
ncbi:MAG: alpha-mannosidase [Clostridia bacterium]|nr:alpha-mannosidase [Clostridia bacterium]